MAAPEVSKRFSPRSPPPPDPYPRLVFIHGKKFKNQTFYNVISEPKERCYLKSIPEFKKDQDVISTHGWLLLFSNTNPPQSAADQLHLWNPLNLESIRFPPFKLKPKQKIDAILLTKPPTHPDSVLLLFASHPPSIIFCFVKDGTWTYRACSEELKLIGRTDHAQDFFLSPVVCNDRIYASTFSRGYMVEIEIVKQRRLVIRPLKCQVPSSYVPGPGCACYSYWVEFCGDLFVIDISFGGVGFKEVVGVDVFKLDFSSMTWNSVESCPNVAFFLGCGRAISCPITKADSDRVGNRVYFTCEEDMALYTYIIQDKTVSVSLLSPEIPTPWRTPFWVLISDDQPQTQSEEDGMEEMEDQLFVTGRQRDDSESIVLNKEKKIEREVANTTLLLDDLPIEILEIISARLYPFDYLNFRGASRLCRSVGSAMQWRNNTVFALREFEEGILSPWLVAPSKANGVCSMLDPIPSDPNSSKHNKYYIMSPDEDYRICYSSNGWLLMANEFFSKEKGYFMVHLRLYNPLTTSIISLPEVPLMDHFLFWNLPSSSDCVVVGISVCESGFYIIEPGMSEWDVQELPQADDRRMYSEQTHIYPVIMDDRLYFLGRNGSLGVVSLEESGNTLRVHQLRRPCRSFNQNFLVECSGDLLSVYIGKAWEWLRVFKLDESAMVWEEVKDLMNKTLYLSVASCIAREAKTPGMGNRIYFPRFYGESIMYYSLDSCGFHYPNKKESENSLMDYYGSKEQLRCCWFEPSWD